MASVNSTRDGVASAIDYSRWDTFGDSDDEARAAKEKAEKLADTRRKALAANAPKPPKVDWSKVKLDDPATLGDLPEGMAEYMKAVSCGQYGAAKNKAKYKLPETDSEKQLKAAEAAALKAKGNELFAQGERFEAAKLYEQAVLKFDWYSDAIADEAEKAIVLPVKVPCHLNLALMSLQLGNYQHAVVHCTQLKTEEYNRRTKQMSHRMIDALGVPLDDAGEAADADGEEATREESQLSRIDGAPSSVPASEGQQGESVEFNAAPREQGPAGANSGSVASPGVMPLQPVPSAYACTDCVRDAADEPKLLALVHPVLGLICPTCHLVLCANDDEVFEVPPRL